MFFKLPGLAGDVESYLGGFPCAVCEEHARGAAISVMATVSQRRCLVARPSFDGDDEVGEWDRRPWNPLVVLFGSFGQPMVDATNALVADVWGRSPLPRQALVCSIDPLPEGDTLAVPGDGSTGPRSGQASPAPTELVSALCAIRDDPANRFVIRMDALARDAYLERVRLCMKDHLEKGDLNQFGPMVRRWLGVAGLLALGCDKRINYEVLRIARDVAIDSHQLGSAQLNECRLHLASLMAEIGNVHPIH